MKKNLYYKELKAKIIAKGFVSKSDEWLLSQYINKYGTLPDGITPYEIGTMAFLNRCRKKMIANVVLRLQLKTNEA